MLDLEQAKQELAKAPARDPSSRAERLRLLLLYSKELYRQRPNEAEKWAQEALALATKVKDDEGIARAHYTIGAANYQLSKYDKAEKEFRAAMELDDPVEFNDPLLERPIFSLGLTLAKKGNFGEGFELLDRALQLSRTHHRKSEIDILGAMGNVALEQGDYPKALRYQYDCLDLLDIQDDPLRRSIVLSNIGWIYLEVGELEKADAFLERSSVLKRELQDIPGLETVTYNRGLAAYKQGDFERARARYTESLDLARSIGRQEAEAYVEDSLGSLELDARNPKEALKHFTNAVSIASALKTESVWCAALIGEGRALLTLKKPKEAIEALHTALLMSEESGRVPFLCECLGALAKSYAATNQLKRSVEYFDRFIALNAEVHNDQKQRALIEIAARVEIEKADRERARMEQIASAAEERATLLHAEAERQSRELTTLALELVQRNEFLCSLKADIEPSFKSPRKAREISERINDHIKSDRDWETFEYQFDQVHRDFLAKLASEFPELTATERKIAALMRLNLSTKSMATLLCLSARTIENHRQQIRRKVGLRKDENLVAWITAFGEAE